MAKGERDRSHKNFVFLDLDLDRVRPDGPALSLTSSQLSAPGGTTCPNQNQELENEWMPIAPALGKFLNPIPFRPIKALNFENHEVLLKRLGLWDFIHLDFYCEIRKDFLEQLVFNFDPKVGFSSVDGNLIEITRVAIARALKLSLGQVEMDVPSEVEDPESIEFIEDFMMNWILLHEDVRMMPEEVPESIGLITKGQLDRVDWAGVICSMAKRELMLLRESGNCYYAWHFQRLIRFQKPGLYMERDMGHMEVINLDDDDDDDDECDVIGLDDMQEPEDHHYSGLLLELGKVGSDEVGHVECEEVEPQYCLVSGMNGPGEHSMQPCNQNDIREMAFQSERRPHRLEEENYDTSMACPENCVQCDHSAEEPFVPRTDTFANVGTTFMSSNSLKRLLKHRDKMDQVCHSDPNKKMRHDVCSDQNLQGFDVCMKQMQSWLDKPRMAEQAHGTAEADEQVLLKTLQKQQLMIGQLERAKNEEIHEREVEISRLTRELQVMVGLLNGYRSALKETQRLFAEYRECHGLPEKPLYGDFVRTAGVVPSNAELKKQGLLREEMESVVEVL